MTVTRKFLWPALALVALLQTSALAKVVWDRHTLIQSGREIVMQVTPVDPRDIFRGDYVILGFPMSAIEHTAEKYGALDPALVTGGAIYATMSPGSDSSWLVTKVSPQYSAEPAAADVVLKGRIERIDHGVEGQKAWINARFGVESYFVPEGTGKVLEQQVRDQKIQAILAVGPDGTVATKGLIVGGERHVAPPLF